MPKKIDKYILGDTIGKGTFSKVKYAVDTTTNQEYAIKIIDRQMIVREGMESQLKREIAIMNILKHKHVIQLKEVLQSQHNIYIVLELVTGGELFDKIVKAKRFPEQVARRYFQQLISAMDYCHSNGIAHRDLKPENLLLDAQDNVKISDFGLSNFSNHDQSYLMTTTCGTPNYVAPEVLSEKGYVGFKADVWSAGIILFVMLCGYLPFEDENIKQLFQKIEKGQYRLPSFLSDGAKHLISRMLVVNPEQRVTIKDIINDPWFAEGYQKEDGSNLLVNLGTKEEEEKATKDAIGSTTETTANVQDNFKIGSFSKKKKSWRDTDLQHGLNAFELISMLYEETNVLQGLLVTDCSSYYQKARIIPNRETSLFCKGVVDVVIKTFISLLEDLKANPNVKDGLIRCNYVLPNQVISFSVRVTPIKGGICFVEIRKIKGPMLEFAKIFRVLLQKIEGFSLTKRDSTNKDFLKDLIILDEQQTAAAAAAAAVTTGEQPPLTPKSAQQNQQQQQVFQQEGKKRKPSQGK